MRFITRTLPWIVILVVIAFFVGLKHPFNSTDAPEGEKISKQTSSTPASSTSQTTDVQSVTSVPCEEQKQKPVPILEEKPAAEEPTTGTEPCPETQTLPKTSTQPTDQPAPTDGDPINIKLYEGAVESETPNQPATSSGNQEQSTNSDVSGNQSAPETQDSPDPNSTTLSDPEGTSLDEPIRLSMNPPVLSQPITNPNPQKTNNQWDWSGAVKEVKAEEAARHATGDAPGNAGPADQGEMPNMYGPAKERPIQNNSAKEDPAETEEEIDIYIEENTHNGASTEEEEATEAAQKTDEPTSNESPANTTPTEKPSPQEPKQREPLSPEMQKLRDGVRQTINVFSQPILNTRDNTVAQLLDVCEAFGCNAEVMYTDNRQKINAFANLCYNYPCAGYHPLKVSGGHIVPKVGYGFQEKPGQMLAVMALGRVPETYPIQVSKEITGTVADLVEREKKTCRPGEDLSFKLIGIARYTPSGETWKSESDKTWTVERLVDEVLNQPAQIDTVAGINRLLALSYAVQQRTKEGKPLDGVYAKAAKYVTDFQKYALAMINNDGTWHPQFLKAKGIGSGQGRLRSTGHILRWLVFSLPEEQLQDPRIIQAITQVQRSLAGNAHYGLASSTPRTIDSRLTGVHALVLYNNRFFKPYDVIEENTASETAQSTKTGVR